VLTVRDELVQNDRPMVQKLVNHIMSAGLWLDASPDHRTHAVEVAAGANFFNQDPEVLKFVMRNPPDRVTYGDLRMMRQEFNELVQLSLDAGILSRPVPYEKFVDESFVRHLRSVEIALDAR
jgi:NitT/TauT family transport system substrate-binding protein